MKKTIAILLSTLLLCTVFSAAAAAGRPFIIPGPTDIVPVVTRRTVTYHSSLPDIPDYTDSVSTSEYACFDSYFYVDGFLYGQEKTALAGWATQPGGKVEFEPGDRIPKEMNGDLEVWAVWVPLALASQEVFSFSNSGWSFEDGRTGYYLSEEDYKTMQLNLFKNFGLGPVPSPILSVVLATYPDWDWRGSCYGMSVVTALQHFGLLDAAKRQNAENLRDAEDDDAMISLINYYQSQAATSWLTENKAYVPGTPLYRAQLRAAYDAVAAGNVVLFTFYEDQAFITPGHTVLLTGAFERADGSRVMIAYDNNDPWEYDGYDFASRFTISPDGATLTDCYGDEVGAFNWTADFSQFTSFSIDRTGTPLAWYKAFFAHVLNLFRTFFRMLKG